MRDSRIVVAEVDAPPRQFYVCVADNLYQQASVFSMRVVRQLCGPGAAGDVIKVRQNQGTLPAKGRVAAAPGLRRIGEPLIRPGHRYLLFLQRQDQLVPNALGQDRVYGIDGSVIGDWDEYQVIPPLFGLWEIASGVVRTPEDPDIPAIPPRRFKFGAQLEGVTEASALQSVADAVLRRGG